jgi:hypothetical protein
LLSIPISTSEGCTRLWKPEIQFDGIFEGLGVQPQFNLASPPGSLDEVTRGPKFVSLTDFIEHFDWKYSDLDIIDRLEIKDLALENFWRYIGPALFKSPNTS